MGGEQGELMSGAVMVTPAALSPSMHGRCRQLPQNGVARWSKSRPPGRLQVLVEDVSLQRIRSRAGQAPHNARGSVIKLDLTIDCLLHHRVDDGAAESAPPRR